MFLFLLCFITRGRFRESEKKTSIPLKKLPTCSLIVDPVDNFDWHIPCTSIYWIWNWPYDWTNEKKTRTDTTNSNVIIIELARQSKIRLFNIIAVAMNYIFRKIIFVFKPNKRLKNCHFFAMKKKIPFLCKKGEKRIFKCSNGLQTSQIYIIHSLHLHLHLWNIITHRAGNIFHAIFISIVSF